MIFRVINWAIHQEIMHDAKLGTLERFGKDVCPHVFGRTILKIKFSRIVEMTNEEVFCFDMFGPFRTQRKSAHIVLVDDIGLDFVALGFEELSRPEDIADFIIETDDFAFARTFGRNFVFC